MKSINNEWTSAKTAVIPPCACAAAVWPAVCSVWGLSCWKCVEHTNVNSLCSMSAPSLTKDVSRERWFKASFYCLVLCFYGASMAHWSLVNVQCSVCGRDQASKYVCFRSLRKAVSEGPKSSKKLLTIAEMSIKHWLLQQPWLIIHFTSTFFIYSCFGLHVCWLNPLFLCVVSHFVKLP